jgi:3-phosphoshikimate 1-carboxyvinyltransferase
MKVEPAARVEGHIVVPGDKSISHRALLIGGLFAGATEVRGWGRSADTESTLRAMRALGVAVEEIDPTGLRIEGVGLHGLRESSEPIDCGNAGTLVRLIAGVLAGQRGRFVLEGDESLSKRPMERIADPLRRMGAAVETTDGTLPLVIDGGDLRWIEYELPVASAQVKSAVLLAGVVGRGATVIEPTPTRDHTELMLRAAGARVSHAGGSIAVDAPQRLGLEDIRVPGDFSSAAPFLAAAALVPGSDMTVHELGTNHLRTGFLDVLERMGGRIATFSRTHWGNESVQSVQVRHAPLVATTVESAEVPRMIDELPLVALLASQARGETIVRGAAELRTKESDRIEAVVDALRAIGVRIRGTADGFVVSGVPTRPRGGKVDAHGDHRIAMLGAVAGVASREGVDVEGAGCVAISFPGFFDLLDSVAQR